MNLIFLTLLVTCPCSIAFRNTLTSYTCLPFLKSMTSQSPTSASNPIKVGPSPGIIVVIGPTACGKTKFSIDVCKALREHDISCEIINADAMQVYKGFDVGTAKPAIEQQKEVKHHMLGFVDPTEDYNASLFVTHCTDLINELTAKGIMPVIVGGTNLYIESLLWPSFVDYCDAKVREVDSLEYERQLEGITTEKLYNMLQESDPRRAQQLHSNDRKRILRALQVIYMYESKPSDLYRQRQDEADKVGAKFDALIYSVTCDLQANKERISERIDEMFQNGLVQECMEILNLGDPNLHKYKKGVFQSIAYKELIPILTSEPFDATPSREILEKCKVTLAEKTRQYAKKQRSWIRNRLTNKSDVKVHPVDTTDVSQWNQLITEAVNAAIQHFQ